MRFNFHIFTQRGPARHAQARLDHLRRTHAQEVPTHLQRTKPRTGITHAHVKNARTCEERTHLQRIQCYQHLWFIIGQEHLTICMEMVVGSINQIRIVNAVKVEGDTEAASDVKTNVNSESDKTKSKRKLFVRFDEIIIGYRRDYMEVTPGLRDWNAFLLQRRHIVIWVLAALIPFALVRVYFSYSSPFYREQAPPGGEIRTSDYKPFPVPQPLQRQPEVGGSNRGLLKNSTVGTGSSDNHATSTGECDLSKGQWIPDSSGPFYTNETCFAIPEHQNCMKETRPGEFQTIDLDFPTTTESYRRYSPKIIANDIKQSVCRVPDTSFDENQYSDIPTAAPHFRTALTTTNRHHAPPSPHSSIPFNANDPFPPDPLEAPHPITHLINHHIPCPYSKYYFPSQPP